VEGEGGRRRRGEGGGEGKRRRDNRVPARGRLGPKSSAHTCHDVHPCPQTKKGKGEGRGESVLPRKAGRSHLGAVFVSAPLPISPSKKGKGKGGEGEERKTPSSLMGQVDSRVTSLSYTLPHREGKGKRGREEKKRNTSADVAELAALPKPKKKNERKRGKEGKGGKKKIALSLPCCSEWTFRRPSMILLSPCVSPADRREGEEKKRG